MLQLFITDQLLKLYVLPVINARLKSLQRESSYRQRSLYNPLDVPTFWRFFARYMLEGLMRSGKQYKDRNLLTELQHELIGTNRYHAIRGAWNVAPSHVLALMEGYRIVIRSNFRLGSTSSVDQWVLDYNGDDAKLDGVFISMKGNKPHRRGIEAFMHAQRLRHSRHPIAIDLEPRIRENKVTPTVALINMIRRAQELVAFPIRVYADSSFTTSKAIRYFETSNSTYVLQLSTSNSCKFYAIHQLASTALPLNRTYRFQTNGALIEIANKDTNKTGVVTNIFADKDLSKSMAVVPYAFADSMSMLEPDQIKHLFKAADGVQSDDPRYLIKLVTGHDIALPPPDEEGNIVISKDTLTKLTVDQLLMVIKDLRAVPPKDKRKDALIRHVLKHHPDAVPDRKRKREEKPVKKGNQMLLTDKTQGSPIVDSYQSSAHYVDIRNEEFFRVFKCAYHNTYPKLMFLATLTTMVLNASAAYQEWKILKHLDQRRGREPPHQTHREFILEVCKQICAKK
jgi:hypothetical protein